MTNSSIVHSIGLISGKIHTGISGPKASRTLLITEEALSAERRMVLELRCVAVMQNTTVSSKMI